MPITNLSLNLFRAFDASARHLNFTSASKELFVTQAAVAHQVKALEDYLQKPLFNRVARGLTLTDEGALLAPIIAKSLREISNSLELIKGRKPKALLNIGIVGTFAIGFLLERIEGFHARFPNIELRLQINNNVPDLLNEHLDFAIRFGEGAWLATRSELIMRAPLTPLCAPELAGKIQKPQDLKDFSLLRSYRKNEWLNYFIKFGINNIIADGPVFDNSRAIADCAMLGAGVGILPYKLFKKELITGRLQRPLNEEIEQGAYYLTSLVQKPMTEAMQIFKAWLIVECENYI